MTPKANRIIGLSALFLFTAIYLIKCNGSSYYIWHTNQRHEFTVEPTHIQLSIDTPVVVEITGELDGKAVVFIPNGPQDCTGVPVWRDNFYSAWLSAGEINKKIQNEMHGDFKLTYQPITAKNGSLRIKTRY